LFSVFEYLRELDLSESWIWSSLFCPSVSMEVWIWWSSFWKTWLDGGVVINDWDVSMDETTELIGGSILDWGGLGVGLGRLDVGGFGWFDWSKFDSKYFITFVFLYLPLMIFVFLDRSLLLLEFFTDDVEWSRLKFDWVLDDNVCCFCESFEIRIYNKSI
jgi:hypothetical protein